MRKKGRPSIWMWRQCPHPHPLPLLQGNQQICAHNQRARAKITIRSTKPVWIEELVEMAEASASSPIFSLLKRPDEKFVTEEAYENPRFVEDAAREIALRLNQDERIDWYRVTVESEESIHNHNAFACVEKED